MVSGRLQIRDWTDREGGKRRSAEVVADNVYFGDSKKDGDAQKSQGGYQNGSYGGYDRPAPPRGNQGGSYPASNYGGFSEPNYDEDDGDLPF